MQKNTPESLKLRLGKQTRKLGMDNDNPPLPDQEETSGDVYS